MRCVALCSQCICVCMEGVMCLCVCVVYSMCVSMQDEDYMFVTCAVCI